MSENLLNIENLKAETVLGFGVELRVMPTYQDDLVTIYNMDCLTVMPALRPLRDLAIIITDPPYGISADQRRGDTGRNKHILQRDYHYGNWDSQRIDDVYFYMMKFVSREQIIFGGNYYGDVLGGTKSWIVWDKENGDNYYADCELAWTSFDRAVRKIKHKWHGFLQQNMKEKEYREHPTQKPLPVMREILENYTTQADIILDPFMGSGTTLVAAKALGRKAIGIEIDPKYCEIAIKRMQAVQQRLTI